MASDAPLVDAPKLLSELRRTFQSGRTKSREWRLEQLRALLKMVMEQEDEISKALSLDLGKSAYETYSCEVIKQFEGKGRRTSFFPFFPTSAKQSFDMN
jgi:acyl-CoA reductase-like NAD-dependent aldehyde dehydrogenase